MNSVISLRNLYSTIRVLEVLGVLAALIAFSYDFMVEKPRDRAVANTAMLAQIASLDPTKPHYAAAMEASVKTLLEGGVSLKGMAIPEIVIMDAKIEDVSVVNSTLRGVQFVGSSLENVQFVGVTASSLLFYSTDLVDVRFWDAGRKWAELCSQTTPAERSIELIGDGAGYVDSEFSHVSFDSVKIGGARLARALFEDPAFRNTEFKNVVLENTAFVSTQVDAPRRWDVGFTESVFVNVQFRGLTVEEMKKIRFENCVFENVAFPEGYKLPEGAGVMLQ